MPQILRAGFGGEAFPDRFGVFSKVVGYEKDYSEKADNLIKIYNFYVFYY